MSPKQSFKGVYLARTETELSPQRDPITQTRKFFAISSDDVYDMVCLRRPLVDRHFDDVLAEMGVAAIRLAEIHVTAFTSLLEEFFYAGRATERRDSLIAFIRSIVGDQRGVLIILACTDLTPAFPESTGQARFTADGFNFLDATAAHVEAILKAAEIELPDQPVSKRMYNKKDSPCSSLTPKSPDC